MTLDKRIAELRADVQSDRLSMSIGELAGIYEKGELDTHPKFQRILRWTPEQKTRLIESILLRIPIPPIFVSQDPNGLWDVVDGAQRLGTIFEFLGLLKDEYGVPKPPLRLTPTVLLPELDRHLFQCDDGTSPAFSNALRLDFRRSRLDINIILKESTPSSKYELFERLNTGGSIASPQEVRNCVLVWMNEKRFDWLADLSRDESFAETVPLSERREEEQYRMELALRFIVLSRIDIEDLRGIKDLSEFLNDRNRDLANDPTFDQDAFEPVFRGTFSMTRNALQSDAFRKYDTNKNRFSGPFLISSFESVALGIAYNYTAWKSVANAPLELENRVKELWANADFTNNIGIGISSSARMQHTIPLGREWFKP